MTTVYDPCCDTAITRGQELMSEDRCVYAWHEIGMSMKRPCLQCFTQSQTMHVRRWYQGKIIWFSFMRCILPSRHFLKHNIRDFKALIHFWLRCKHRELCHFWGTPLLYGQSGYIHPAFRWLRINQGNSIHLLRWTFRASSICPNVKSPLRQRELTS